MNIPRSWYDSPWYQHSKHLLFESLYRSGLLSFFRHFHRKPVLVLTYHDVLPDGFPEDNPLFGMTVSASEFEWQLSYLCRHYTPITYAQFADWLLQDAPLPLRPVLLTFDDGHRNILQYAGPLLRKHKIPAVCFVITGSLGARQQTWVEEGYYRILDTPVAAWRLTTGESLPLTTTRDRGAACGRFFTLFRTLPESAQRLELENLRNQLPISSDGREFPDRFEFLDASGLQLLRQHNVEVGAHSVSHPIFATLSEQRVKEEVVSSKSHLESSTGAEIRAFAYPFGMPDLDFSSRDADIVKQAGFELAFAANDGFVSRNSAPFALPRFGIGRMTRAQFAATISGALAFLKMRMG